MEENEEKVCVPIEIRHAAKIASSNILPKKSKGFYEKGFRLFS